jgi:nitrate/TMAO reductase-like tetraheme cytochrome c subunit
MTPPDSKQCASCKQVKPYTEFYKEPRIKSGYRSRCKACHIKIVRSYADNQQHNSYQKKYYQRHLSYYADYRDRTREAYRAKRRADGSAKLQDRDG